MERPRFPSGLETERLIIRTLRPGDGALTNAAILDSFEDLHVWMDWASQKPDIAESEGRALEATNKAAMCEDFTVVVIRKSDGVLVAMSGLHVVSWKVPSFEIGYWSRTGHQGQGYVSEAVRAITRVGFEVFGANRIQICCDELNVRSRRVAERSGYPLEAILKNDKRTPDGRLRNTVIYALVPEIDIKA